MECINKTSITEFILLGLPNQLEMQILLFVIFCIIYTITLLGNSLIIMIIRVDPRLHTPMYFFLSNLSFLDICYSSSIVPKMLNNFLSNERTISFPSCITQMYIANSLGGTECFLLAIMSFDRYVAICNPLRYTVIMNKKVCIQVAAGSWICGFLDSFVHTIFVLKLPFRGPNVINHFLCEVPAVLNLACADISMNKIVIFACAIVVVLIPFLLILISYVHIISTVLKIRSAEGRHKAFSTCASHLIVVTFSYGTIIFMYMRPRSSHSQDQDKMATLFYSVITPLLNPMIYSLRNQEVKGALRKAAERHRSIKKS
ncbi:olfactory receptor 2D3-like [Rhinatrema bivittatum]|uniref:olfactory receptor 2D3-like n=1 Tax=Rhinatrema bivittatum TaxID=194408 RepID=UPI001128AEEE|nr:olfactory receptor 2D3-like [Rhinatrema bivittatum]